MADFPSRSLFKAVVACRRMDPPATLDGDLSDWEGIDPLPPLAELDGREAFAEVFVAWNEHGLYVAERCSKPEGTVAVNRRIPHSGDGMRVWIDTRATQTAHRATRYCHQFILLPKGGGPSRDEPIAWQSNIHRARERAPLCEASDIMIGAAIGEGYYTIEAHFPQKVLGGFEPAAGTRIAFNFMVHDIPGGRFTWSTPRGFPADWDPSLWGLLELSD